MTDQTCQKWFVKLHAGDFLLDDAPWSGRPVEVDSDQNEALIENNQHYAMQDIANILKTSKSIVIGENEKCISYFTEKNIQTFWLTQNFALDKENYVTGSSIKYKHSNSKGTPH